MQKTAPYLQRIFEPLVQILRGFLSLLLLAFGSLGVVIASGVAVMLLVLFCVLGGLLLYVEAQPKRAHGIDDGQNYLFDIASALGPEWRTGSIRSEKNGDVFSADIFGPYRSLIGRSEYSTANRANSLAYFRQEVFLFENKAEANNHFDEEREWIFIYAYGESISRQDYPFIDVELPSEVVFQADEYQVACSEAPIIDRCNALFRYENYIVFVDAVLSRDSIQYLTEDDFVVVLDLIDEKMRDNP